MFTSHKVSTRVAAHLVQSEMERNLHAFMIGVTNILIKHCQLLKMCDELTTNGQCWNKLPT